MTDMTEHWLYLAVRIGCCTYIIYKVWGWKKKIRRTRKKTAKFG